LIEIGCFLTYVFIDNFKAKPPPLAVRIAKALPKYLKKETPALSLD
jgi:hypothetical protein